MKFAFVGDDFFIECYRILIAQGATLAGAWVSERDNVYSSNKRVTKLCQQLNAPIIGQKVIVEELQNLIDNGLDLLIIGMHAHKVPVTCLPKYHMNIHPSLLPMGRGPNPIPGSILRAEKKTGLTFHKLTDKWDEGDILLQHELAIAPYDTHDSLSIKHMQAAARLMLMFVSDMTYYWDNAKAQSGGSYWQKVEMEKREINWEMSVEEIDRMIRAFGRYGVNVRINEKLCSVKHAICWQEEHGLKPGTVLTGYERDIAFTCADGIVCLSQNS